MGLAERKVKQKIGNDPRNLTWSQDQSRFSYQHLAKFGWDPSKGLGASASGNPNHITVVKRLDSSGIGVARALKEGGEVGGAGEGLDALLKRLKKAGGDGGGAVVKPIVFGDDDQEDGGTEEKEERDPQASSSTTTVPIVAPQPLRIMASRAKYQKAKRLAASSPAAMAEILGLPVSSLPASPSPLATSHTSSPAPVTVTVTQTEIPAGTGTPKPMGLGFRPPEIDSSTTTSTPAPADALDERSSEQMLTKSNVSLGEYFRQKMLQKRLEREGKIKPGEQLTQELLDKERPVNSEIAKEFVGKKVVFAQVREEDQTEGSTCTGGIGSSNRSSDGQPIAATTSSAGKKRKRSEPSTTEEDIEAAQEVEDMIASGSATPIAAVEAEQPTKKSKKSKKDKSKGKARNGDSVKEAVPSKETKEERKARKAAKKQSKAATADAPSTGTARFSPSTPISLVPVVALAPSVAASVTDDGTTGMHVEKEKKSSKREKKANSKEGGVDKKENKKRKKEKV